MKIKLTFFILILINSIVFGQTEIDKRKYLQTDLKGKILIPEGKEIPEEGIHIHIFGENKDFFTDQEGNYVFEDLRKSVLYKIRVLIYGYKSKEIAVVTSSKSLTEFNIRYEMECEFDSARALSDWKSGNAKLFRASGIASYVNPSDKPFEEKYGIEYYDFGCNAPNDICISDYNAKIFELMDLKYGNNWREEVREDIEH
tara:strand:- start:1612 stop:2211 length:600 start_codon:yes stop_codon:yes gene_type:complete